LRKGRTETMVSVTGKNLTAAATWLISSSNSCA
jgi:hypothetical protein